LVGMKIKVNALYMYSYNVIIIDIINTCSTAACSCKRLNPPNGHKFSNKLNNGCTNAAANLKN
jgi:hypothetical protein